MVPIDRYDVTIGIIFFGDSREYVFFLVLQILFVGVKQNRFLAFLLNVFDVFHHGCGNGEATVAHGQAGQGKGLYLRISIMNQNASRQGI